MSANIFRLYENMQSDARNSIKTLMSNIQFASLSRPTPIRSIVITSSIPNEGKSHISTFLAIAMAGAGKKTLIVDCDLRHASLRREMQIPRTVGYIGYLTGELTLDQAIQHTEVENLDFLDAEARVPNPVELLGSKKLEDMITALYEHYDFIIFDTPPLSTFIDAALLSSKVDGTVLVVRSGAVDKRLLRSVQEQLTQANANLIGVTMNFVEKKKASYYYYYRYYRKYYNRGDKPGKR